MNYVSMQYLYVVKLTMSAGAATLLPDLLVRGSWGTLQPSLRVVVLRLGGGEGRATAWRTLGLLSGHHDIFPSG